MKKHYEKPEIQVIALELSEAIATCNDALYVGSTESKGCEKDPTFTDMGVNFTGDDSTCDSPLMDYCYTTAGNLLMNS